jgi:hypothetical protein
MSTDSIEQKGIIISNKICNNSKFLDKTKQFISLLDKNQLVELFDFMNSIRIKVDEELKRPTEPATLTYNEREYLSNIIKPFKDKVEYIIKESYFDDYSPYESTNIYIHYIDNYNKNNSFNFPIFDVDNSYIGMEDDVYYTLKDLGLEEIEDNKEDLLTNDEKSIIYNHIKSISYELFTIVKIGSVLHIEFLRKDDNYVSITFGIDHPEKEFTKLEEYKTYKSEELGL